MPRVDTQTLINKTQHEIIYYTNADMNMHECIMMSSVHYNSNGSYPFLNLFIKTYNHEGMHNTFLLVCVQNDQILQSTCIILGVKDQSEAAKVAKD